MALDIEVIKGYLRENKVHWRGHILTRMQQRGIRIDDVFNCILNGEVIEDYPADYPYPSCLVLGRTHNNNALHVVCSVGQDYVWMITTYYPDGDEWIEGFRERRR